MISPYNLFMLTAVGNALAALCAPLNVIAALADGKVVRAVGWSGLTIAYAVLAVAFFLRAMGASQ